MKIAASVKSGITRSLRAWKGILIMWFVILLMVSMVAIPMKGVLQSGLGDSMITEKLAAGINIDFFADMSASFKSLVSYFSNGLLMIIITGFFINTFLTGGLFNSLKKHSGSFSYNEFFKSSADNFWSFSGISLIVNLIIVLVAIVVIIIPISVFEQAEFSSEGSLFKAVIITISIFLLIVAYLYIVADYARAWQAISDKGGCFRALRFAFRQTAGTFFLSCSLMLILLLFQLFYGLVVFKLLTQYKPVSGIGVFMLFLFSQILFYIKLMMKATRYGSITKMMELNTVSPDQ
jgi:hypothetical protein